MGSHPACPTALHPRQPYHQHGWCNSSIPCSGRPCITPPQGPPRQCWVLRFLSPFPARALRSYWLLSLRATTFHWSHTLRSTLDGKRFFCLCRFLQRQSGPSQPDDPCLTIFMCSPQWQMLVIADEAPSSTLPPCTATQVSRSGIHLQESSLNQALALGSPLTPIWTSITEPSRLPVARSLASPCGCLRGSADSSRCSAEPQNICMHRVRSPPSRAIPSRLLVLDKPCLQCKMAASC